MEQTTLRLKEFVNNRIPELKENGRVYVMFLLTHDSREYIYREIRNNWHVLDELTGDIIQFVFFASSESRVYHGFRNDIQDRHHNNPFEHAHFDYADMHICNVNELKYVFDVSNSSMPCLVFWNLVNGNKQIVKLPDENTDIVETIDRIVGACDKRFKEFHRLNDQLRENYSFFYRYENELMKQCFIDYISNNELPNKKRHSYQIAQRQRELEDLKNEIDSLMLSNPDLQTEYNENKQALIEFANECDECIRVMSVPEKRKQYDASIKEILILLEEINDSLSGTEKEKTQNIINTIKKNGFLSAKYILGLVGVIANVQAVFPTVCAELVNKVASLTSLFG